MIKFGLYTGQRLSDIAALTWSNIDLERNFIRLTTRSFVLKNKGAIRGIRLVDRFSIDAFLNSKAEASCKCDAPRQRILQNEIKPFRMENGHYICDHNYRLHCYCEFGLAENEEHCNLQNLAVSDMPAAV
jgi:integrase